MKYQHKGLVAGRWENFSFMEQMANVASEIERSFNWRLKNNIDYSHKAFQRGLELLDLILDNTRDISRLKELCRVREALVDYFLGINQFKSTDASWRKYFSAFAYASRKNC
jgi:hypothetical protein